MKLLLTVQYIPDRDSRVMDEVGFRVLLVGFRIPGTGFRIPKAKKCWIPGSLIWGEFTLSSILLIY